MALLQWDGSLATGIGSIDLQHKELFRVINSMQDRMAQGDARTAFTAILDSLSNYVHYHFTHEESLLERFGWPGLDEHRLEHEGFTRKLEAFGDTPEGGETRALVEMQSFLLAWLVNHIQQTDMAYRDFLLEKGVE